MNEELMAALKSSGKHRPYFSSNGESVVCIDRLVQPSELKATLRKEDWIALDRACLQQFRKRSPTFCMLCANGCGSKMEPCGDARTRLTTTPLPMIWLKFTLSEHIPMDTAAAEAVGRRVGETLEMRTVETLTTLSERYTYTCDNLQEFIDKAARKLRNSEMYDTLGLVASVSYDALPEYADLGERFLPLETAKSFALKSGEALLLHLSPVSVTAAMPIQPTLVQLGDEFVFATVADVVPRVAFDGSCGVCHLCK